MRADEYRARYESMRDLEWKVLLQVYTGYAAIAGAFAFLTHDKPPVLNIPAGAIAVIFLAATIVFFVQTLRMSYRIEERLIAFDAIYERHMNEIHRVTGVTTLDDLLSLGDPYFWTYRIQSSLSSLVFFGLLLYECMIGSPPDTHLRLWHWILPFFLLLGLANWMVTRKLIARLRLNLSK